MRKDLQIILTNNAQRDKYVASIVTNVVLLSIIITDTHLEECLHVPINCPGGCLEDDITRSTLDGHKLVPYLTVEPPTSNNRPPPTFA